MQHGILALALAVTPVAHDTVPVRQVALHFEATVGATPFRCGSTYALGRTAANTTVTDFRFFVHQVELLRPDGTTVPVTLAQDGLWQDGDLALLDFEDGTASCANGTPELHRELTGTVPVGQYTGARFIIGVPFERNHLDLATQRPPLTLSRLFWSWTGGYKFMRVDLRALRSDTTAAVPWMIHLGSSGCEKAGDSPVPSHCATANRPVITLMGYDPDRDVIAFDLAQLVAGADLLGNQPKTAAGCMSGPDDTDCAPVFAALGLPHPTTHSQPVQRAFRVQRPTP